MKPSRTNQPNMFQSSANHPGTFFQQVAVAAYQGEHGGDFTPQDIAVLRQNPGVQAVARGAAAGAAGGAAAGTFFGPGIALGAASGAIAGGVAGGVNYLLTPTSAPQTEGVNHPSTSAPTPSK